MEFKERIKALERDIQVIDRSDGYNQNIQISDGYLMKGSGADSSKHQQRRMDFVREALHSDEIQEAVLEKAKEIAQDKLDALIEEAADIVANHKTDD